MNFFGGIKTLYPAHSSFKLIKIALKCTHTELKNRSKIVDFNSYIVRKISTLFIYDVFRIFKGIKAFIFNPLLCREKLTKKGKNNTKNNVLEHCYRFFAIHFFYLNGGGGGVTFYRYFIVSLGYSSC